MNTYLTIMVTVLVTTQVIRITQNAINLHRQNGEIKKACGWIRDNDVSELDFQIQRDTFYRLNRLLREKEATDVSDREGSVRSGEEDL